MDIKIVQSWLSGEKLRSEAFRKQYKLIALIAALFFIYILAGYNSMRQQRHLGDLKREVKIAKFEYLTISAELAEKTRQSKIHDQLQSQSSKLQENRTPIIQIRKHK